MRNALRTTHATAPIYLVLVGTIPAVLTICLSIFIAVLAAQGAMIFLPFHFPLAVFELGHRNPAFISARCWRQKREVRVGQPERPERLHIKTSVRRKSGARLKRSHGNRHLTAIIAINTPAIISAANQLV